MKKYLSFLLLVLAVLVFTGCGYSGSNRKILPAKFTVNQIYSDKLLERYAKSKVFSPQGSFVEFGIDIAEGGQYRKMFGECLETDTLIYNFKQDKIIIQKNPSSDYYLNENFVACVNSSANELFIFSSKTGDVLGECDLSIYDRTNIHKYFENAREGAALILESSTVKSLKLYVIDDKLISEREPKPQPEPEPIPSDFFDIYTMADLIYEQGGDIYALVEQDDQYVLYKNKQSYDSFEHIPKYKTHVFGISPEYEKCYLLNNGNLLLASKTLIPRSSSEVRLEDSDFQYYDKDFNQVVLNYELYNLAMKNKTELKFNIEITEIENNKTLEAELGIDIFNRKTHNVISGFEIDSESKRLKTNSEAIFSSDNNFRYIHYVDGPLGHLDYELDFFFDGDFNYYQKDNVVFIYKKGKAKYSNIYMMPENTKIYLERFAITIDSCYEGNRIVKVFDLKTFNELTKFTNAGYFLVENDTLPYLLFKKTDISTARTSTLIFSADAVDNYSFQTMDGNIEHEVGGGFFIAQLNGLYYLYDSYGATIYFSKTKMEIKGLRSYEEIVDSETQEKRYYVAVVQFKDLGAKSGYRLLVLKVKTA